MVMIASTLWIKISDQPEVEARSIGIRWICFAKRVRHYREDEDYSLLRAVITDISQDHCRKRRIEKDK
jgi:hypothetical protein